MALLDPHKGPEYVENISSCSLKKNLVLELVPVLFEEGWNKFDQLIVVDIRDLSEIGVEQLGFFVVRRIEKVYSTFVHLDWRIFSSLLEIRGKNSCFNLFNCKRGLAVGRCRNPCLFLVSKLFICIVFTVCH